MFHRGMSKSSGRSGGPKSGVRGKRVRGLASGLLLVSFLGAANIVAGPPASAATNVNVFVAYADNLRPSGFFPTPWKGAPNTLFIGNGPSFDAGAIRLDNPTGAPLPVDNVSVDLQRPGPVFKLWGSFTIPAHGSAILTQTGQYNFDTSDYPLASCPTPAASSDKRIPKVTVTIAGTSLDAEVKEFSTGSLGWYLNSKATVEIDGVRVSVQIGLNLTIVGSKDLPKDDASPASSGSASATAEGE